MTLVEELNAYVKTLHKTYEEVFRRESIMNDVRYSVDILASSVRLLEGIQFRERTQEYAAIRCISDAQKLLSLDIPKVAPDFFQYLATAKTTFAEATAFADKHKSAVHDAVEAEEAAQLDDDQKVKKSRKVLKMAEARALAALRAGKPVAEADAEIIRLGLYVPTITGERQYRQEMSTAWDQFRLRLGHLERYLSRLENHMNTKA